MKPVFMTVLHDASNGVHGDCFRACIASILEVPAEAVEHFMDEGGSGPKGLWWTRLVLWCTDRGLYPISKHGDQSLEIGCYAVVSGPTFREFHHHCIVVLGGEMVHDPEGPEGRGIPLMRGVGLHSIVFAITEPYMFAAWWRSVQ